LPWISTTSKPPLDMVQVDAVNVDDVTSGRVVSRSAWRARALQAAVASPPTRQLARSSDQGTGPRISCQ
jgi:hypothetical protein